MTEAKTHAEALLPRFKLERLLNQGHRAAGRRSSLLGSIDDKPALLILERAPFPVSTAYLGETPAALSSLKNLGANDIYFWFLARSGIVPSTPTDDADADFFADLKINLIYPCTSTHVAKYSKQPVRLVTETAEIYRDHVRPYMQRKRDEGRLNWVYNIIEGRKEVEDVIYRTPLGAAGDEGFLLLPDLNWDRKTLDALHLLGARRAGATFGSLRDLRRRPPSPWVAAYAGAASSRATDGRK
ncbi:DCS2 [Verticillium alfalfae VaMs.102]|uniref:DCS2 n=1 Tax=Verticillium alfalfae (strain VaMs.102 / ATCC MYA-4576 / FGSC 10136) TaxID=526221 RepID=C9S675_VERA1|nr:DCS2 [Verticillium alfalfae VaMs.102]EEY15137.1 DCS2 [Verticillium alfalfae VaMs.102]